VPVSGLTDATALSAGSAHTCALRADSLVFCWGANGFGQLGDGTTLSRPWPETVEFGAVPGAIAVTAGGFHTCALLDNGIPYCWGSNFTGQLGDGTTTDRHTPVKVPSFSLDDDLTIRETPPLSVD
jgi:alpha-tubulin suppressor-like RCC1 family protein